MDGPLTVPQARALGFLVKTSPTYPSAIARLMWPDSLGWAKRSRRRGGGNRNGALGATLPMSAAKLLWKLQTLGYATVVDGATWSATDAGHAAAAELSMR